MCACARVSVCARARARARSLMATLPGGGPAEDGSELRSHACGVAKVEARGHAPGVGRIVIVTPRGVLFNGTSVAYYGFWLFIPTSGDILQPILQPILQHTSPLHEHRSTDDRSTDVLAPCF